MLTQDHTPNGKFPALKAGMLGVGLLVLAGCASQPDYSCDIPEDCSPIHENYDRALQDTSPNGWASDGSPARFEHEKKKAEEQKKEESGGGWFSGWFGSDDDEDQPLRPVMQGEADVHSGPVFIPPRPHRIWLGHWTGEMGELNSGSYTYLTTPGFYEYMGERYKALPYGTTGTKGSVSAGGIPSATFHPVHPDQLGFQPEESNAPDGVLEGMVQPNTGAN